jgi:hypothetical protein
MARLFVLVKTAFLPGNLNCPPSSIICKGIVRMLQVNLDLFFYNGNYKVKVFTPKTFLYSKQKGGIFSIPPFI